MASADQNPLHKALDELRKFDNRRPIPPAYRPTGPAFHQADTAIFVARDADLAMDAFLAKREAPKERYLYLETYGYLQALFVQQDAIRNLWEAMMPAAKRWRRSARLSEIRDLRNASIGHPSKQTQGVSETSFNVISQSTMSVNGFEMHTRMASGRFSTCWVKLPVMAEVQRRLLARRVRGITTNLRRAVAEYRKQFRGNPMKHLFDNHLNYAFQKLAEALSQPNIVHVGAALAMWVTVEEFLRDFENGCKNRDRDLPLHFDDLRYAATRVKEVLDALAQQKRPRLPLRVWRVLGWFVIKEIRGLEVAAQEIDRLFRSGK